MACALQVGTGEPKVIGENQMQRFSSYYELKKFLEPLVPNYARTDDGGIVWRSGGILTFAEMNSMGLDNSGVQLVPKSSTDFSETNNQVVGVDEADIIKTDGEYIYYTAGNKVYIVKAFPADKAELVSEIELEGGACQMYVNGDRLVVLEGADGYGYRYFSYSYYPVGTKLKVYDISDIANPILVRNISSDAFQVSSRMIGDHVYVVMNEWAHIENGQLNFPEFEVDGSAVLVPVRDIYRPDIEDNGYGYTTIMAMNIKDDAATPKYSTLLLGSGSQVYVSTSNIYVTAGKYTEDGQKTEIHRFAIDESSVTYQAVGEIPGYLLNQFSMDEHNGYFRVVTTSDGPTEIDRWTTKNNIYVLDMNMVGIGKVEDLAPGERIYSARFMGDRGYMVTFRQVDPLFAIDLSDPANPEVLGELKITGYSDYLHPYDENHLIGIGKEATEDGRFLGVKIALFDVSDINNPVQIDVYEIGDRGTESPVLHDHKAFLFDKESNMMVMPVLIAEVEENAPDWQWGHYVWQGAYVFDITPETGIALRGGITHYDDGFEAEDYWYRGNALNDVKRSLYIDDVLYTISDCKLKLNNLETLEYIDEVELWDGVVINPLDSVKVSPAWPSIEFMD
jgi:uncharacterized secreted protein with C-terminal beta-propeller domain